MTAERTSSQKFHQQAEKEPKSNSEISKLVDNFFNPASDFFASHIKSPGTEVAYRCDLSQFVNFCQSRSVFSLEQFQPEVVKDWIGKMQEKNYKPASINRKVATLRCFITWLISEEKITEDLKGKLPGYLISERVQIRPLTSEQIKTLLEASKDWRLRNAALVQIAVKTGAKTEEIARLKTKDLCFQQDGSLAIRLSDQDRKRERTILVDEEASIIIESYLKKELKKRSGYLFPSRNTRNIKHLTRQGVWHILKNFGKKKGIANLTPELLRNTFAANLTGSTQERAEILGVSESTATQIQNSIRNS